MIQQNGKIRLIDVLSGKDKAPFIVAEMSGNHNQSLERALGIVDAAAKAGAHALKLQTYKADTMTLDLSEGEFFIDDSRSHWSGQSLYDLYSKAYTPWEWHEQIFDRANSLGMAAFSSPFDASAVDFLEDLSVPCYKIASFENTDIPLIRKAAATGKPMIISTGMASYEELQDAVNAARDAGCEHLTLLKCTSTYPSSPENTNLATIPHMRDAFDCCVGLSDHTMGIGVAVASVTMEACVIEKHFTLDRGDGGVDSQFSLEPHELAALVEETDKAYKAIGSVHYGPTEAEGFSVTRRRSLYIGEDLKAGDVLSDTNVRVVRPGHGLAPKHFYMVMGKRVNCDVKKGTPLDWALLD